MIFGVNTSPMAGREGQYVTSRQVRDRLERELIGNVSIRLENTDSSRNHQGDRPRRAAAVDSDRDDAARGVRAAGLETRDRHQREQRAADGAGRRPGDRRARGLSGCGHRAGGRPQGHDDQDGEPRQRPRADGVPHSGARAHRVPLAVPDRHPRHRHHEPPLCRLGALAWRDRVARDGCPRVRPDRGRRRPTRSANLQERGEIFIAPGSPCTRA